MYYNRPIKDPLLQEYTLEELTYEYHSIYETEKAKRERAEAEADKIEEDKHNADIDWANQMEAMENSKTKVVAPPKKDPAEDPENARWIEEQMRKEQEAIGEDYGRDLHI